MKRIIYQGRSTNVYLESDVIHLIDDCITLNKDKRLLQAEIDKLKKKIEWYKDKHAKALRRQFNLENESEPMVNRVDELLASLEQIKTLVHNPLGNHNNPVWIIADEAVKEKKE